MTTKAVLAVATAPAKPTRRYLGSGTSPRLCAPRTPGPFEILLDVMFTNAHVYRAVKRSGLLSGEVILWCQKGGGDPEEEGAKICA